MLRCRTLISAKKFFCYGRQNSCLRDKFETWAGEQIETVGEVMVKVEYNEQVVKLPLVLVQDRDASSLLGRDWLEQLKLDWNKIQQV